MVEAYDSAALRHYEDAERLAQNGRFDNAGHLVGFAAECALKHHFGVTAAADSPKTHLPDIAAALRKGFSSRDARQAAMRALLDGYGTSFFADWSIHQRYSETGKTTRDQYERWRGQARRALSAAGFRLADVRPT